MNRSAQRIASAALLLAVLALPALSRAGDEHEPWIEVPMFLVPDDFPTIQAAIDRSRQPGMVPLVRVRVGSPEAIAALKQWPSAGLIVVRPGVYHEALDVRGAPWIVSTHGPAATVIDGDGVRRPVTATDGNLLLDGFTLANGVADEGGGVAFYRARGVLSNVVLRDNRARVGGAVYLGDGSRTVYLQDALVLDSTASEDGGAIWMGYDVGLRLDRARILRSRAGGSGGAIAMLGARGTLFADQLVLDGNAATGDGGAFLLRAPQSALASWTNAVVTRNAAARGGGIYVAAPTSTRFTHLTVAANDATEGGGFFAEPGADHDLSSSILWGNATPPVLSVMGAGHPNAIVFSDVEGDVLPAFTCTSCYANFSADPLFADPAAGDFWLQPGSPAIDRISTMSWGSYGGGHDVDGDPRPGWGGFLDVGAYEAGVPRVVAPVALAPALVPTCGGLDTVTAMVDLPAGLAPATGTPTVRIGEVLTASSAEVRGDRLLATFDRALLLGLLGESASATLAVSGTVPGSVRFRGTASVEVAGPCAIGAAGAR